MMRQEPLYIWAGVFALVTLLTAGLSLAGMLIVYPRGAQLSIQRELRHDHDVMFKHLQRLERCCLAHN